MPDLVIARYNENVSWLLNVPDDYNIFLYNKGDELDISNIRSKLTGYFRIPNIGRESDTYLLHMIHNMGKTDSFTVFSQGDPFEHSPNFLHLLTHRFADDAWGYSSQWKQGFPPAHLIETHIARTGQPTRNEIFSLYNWGPVYSFDEGAFLISHLYSLFYRVENGTNIAADFFRRIGHEAAQKKAAQATLGEFPYAAIFGVRNNVANHIPKDIFLRALHEVRTNEMAGHIMERLWLHFFGRPFISIGNDASNPWVPRVF